MPSWRCVLVFLMFTAATLRCYGQRDGEQRTPGNERLLQSFSQPIDGVNWDELAPHYVQMMERLFERNGWNDEADQFAMRVASHVAAVPPWDITGRLQALNSEIARRYELTPEQSVAFQQAVMRELGGFLLRHGPAMWGQAKEALQGRSQGKPYTAEQIARWAEMGKPLFDDIEGSIERVAGVLEDTLSEERKAVLQADMAGFRKRQTGVKAMNERWARGEWKPEEWGLEDDPIQNSRAKKAEDKAASAAPIRPAPLPPPALVEPVVAVAIPTRWVEHDPATWIALVVEYQKKYVLDAGQMDTAWSIHGELVERAQRYFNSRKAELAAVTEAQKAQSPEFGPIRELFGELRDRLNALPTTQQREANVKK